MVRKPAVAGIFYPADKKQLQKVVRGYLQKGKEVKSGGALKALLVPHAGYVYSGVVAGAGFRLLEREKFEKVVLLGPSHQVYFAGAALLTEDLLTPLGVVKVGNPLKWLGEDLIVDLREAHSREHSLEVEVPFLQETLKNFELYPLVLGDVEEKELAEAISRYIDESTLVVVSSDLSHYLSYDAAVRKDRETISKILGFNFREIDACGEKPIKVLMHLAQKLSWKPFLIDYQNSGDTSGDKSRVVGYAAIGYHR